MTNERATLPAAVAAFVALPLLIAFVVPIALARADPWRSEFRAAGLAVVGIGVIVLAATVVSFFTIGRGTLAPWNPPRELVTTGLFAWCRNPMYVGVLIVVAGWAASFRSPLTAGFAVLIAVGFHVRVIVSEEPWAARTFGEQWSEYAERVPRWLPRRPAAHDEEL